MWVEHLQEPEHVLIIHVQGGLTALYIASRNRHMEVMQSLLQKHADVSISKTVYYNTLCNLSPYCVHLHIPHHVGTPYTPTYVPVTT